MPSLSIPTESPQVVRCDLSANERYGTGNSQVFHISSIRLTNQATLGTFSGVQELDELLIHDRLVPPDVKTRIVYHYTSAAGLMGILGSGSIRGTNAAFLNDTSEIAYGLSVCVAVLEEERSGRKSAVEQVLLERTLGSVHDDASPSEWRSIATIRDEDLVVGFEAVKGLPRPYIRMLEGSRTSGRLPVVEVCVGPAERKQVAIHATRLLLSRYGYGNAAVTHTDIPFAP